MVAKQAPGGGRATNSTVGVGAPQAPIGSHSTADSSATKLGSQWLVMNNGEVVKKNKGARLKTINIGVFSEDELLPLDTQRAKDHIEDLKIDQSRVTLLEKMQRSTATNSTTAGGNAQFLKYPEAVHSTCKKLDEEVAAAITTKKEIKILVATVVNTTRGLVKWDRSNGRVKPLIGNKASQTTADKYRSFKPTQTEVEEVAFIKDTKVPSPDRSRFEHMSPMSELKEMTIS